MGKGSSQNGSDQLEELRQHVRILCDLGRLAGNSTDLQTFLQQAVAQVARGIAIHHVKILRYRPETADLLLVAGTGWKPGVVGTATLSTDLRSAPGRAFQTGEAISIRNFDEQDEYELSPLLKEHDIVSLVNAPVLIGGSAWGVLEVDSTTPREFGPDTCDFLTAAGTLIGTCVRRHAAPSQGDNLANAMLQAQQRETLLREMQHRVSNILSLVQSISRQTFQPEISARTKQVFEQRLSALAQSHALLRETESDTVELRALLDAIATPFDPMRFSFVGQRCFLASQHSTSLALLLHELATNAVKYGALSVDGGRVSVKWISSGRASAPISLTT